MNKKYPSVVIISILIIVSIVVAAASTTTSVGTVSPLATHNALNCVLVQVTGEDTRQFINRLSEEDLVRYVEPNKLVRALYTPNDPCYPNQ